MGSCLMATFCRPRNDYFEPGQTIRIITDFLCNIAVTDRMPQMAIQSTNLAGS
jgi:hypothetical protein